MRLKLAQSIKSTRTLVKGSRILFYVPEAGVVPHFALLSLLAKTLQESGYCVAMVRCYELFQRCPTKDMRNLPATTSSTMHSQICVHCAKSSFEMAEAYDLPIIDLRVYLNQEIQTRIAWEIGSLGNDILNYKFEGIAFGRISANQVALSMKASFLDEPTEEIRAIWKQYIQTALMNYLLMHECLKDHKVPTLVSYNDYVPSMAARVAVRMAGGNSVCVGSAMHKNVDRTRPIFHQNLGGAWLSEQHRSWHQWKDLPVSPSFIREIGDDSLNNFRSHGIHIYSPNKTYFEGDLREKLKIDPDKKLVVAYTSSLDEMLSMKHLMLALDEPFYEPAQPFINQIDWLRQLIDFCSHRPDLQLWIRIHPREGSNPRNWHISEHLIRLRENFSSEARARFVWPEEKLSSYDLAEVSDLCLISWSTIGLELSRVGVPVIATTNNEIAPIPHGDFLQWVDNSTGYFRLIEENLREQKTSFQTIKNAFRWYFTSRLGHSINIDDVTPHSDYIQQPPFRMPRRAADIVDVIAHNRSILDINRAREPIASQEVVEAERVALTSQLKRFLHYFATNEDSIPSGVDAICENGFITYRHNGNTSKKYSPLASRLLNIVKRS